MKKYCLFFLFLHTVVHSQECSEEFIREIMTTYNREVVKFDSIVQEHIKPLELEEGTFEVIHVPMVVSTKEGEILTKKNSLASGVKDEDELLQLDLVGKEKIFCLLDRTKLMFGESFIVTDSIIYQVVKSSPVTIYLFDSKYTNKKYNWECVNKIRELLPDFVFEVCNIPYVYWCVKGEQLYVIWSSKESLRNSEIEAIDTAEDYITNHMDPAYQLCVKRYDSVLAFPPKKKKKFWRFGK